MLTLKRTNSDNTDFQQLVLMLNKDLEKRNGVVNDFFVQFNKIDEIKNVIIIYENHQAVGCGAMKKYDDNTMEIKRMYVPLENRGKGIATKILQELEIWAKENGLDLTKLRGIFMGGGQRGHGGPPPSDVSNTT